MNVSVLDDMTAMSTFIVIVILNPYFDELILAHVRLI